MVKQLTEDQVRDTARKILDMENVTDVVSGVGQLTTFNQLGFKGVADKPDGWYLPNKVTDTAIVLETKASKILLDGYPTEEVLKNIKIIQEKYKNVIGILYNGNETKVYKGLEEFKEQGSSILHNIDYYISLFDNESLDKEKIYSLTAKINNLLHHQFGIKNLYHRMIFTACALVAERYDGHLSKLIGLDYATFHTSIQSTLGKSLAKSRKQNEKIGILLEEYADIKMNITDNQDAIDSFITWVVEISENINSSEWRGEDVMGIFFNEFNRYKGKSESGQIFTPEHITDFMYRILEVDMNDYILDAACGSGGFLVKAMANMIQEAGGIKTKKAKDIKSNQLFGIDIDREIYALACANMLIHKDGKTNLEQMDSKTDEASEWIKSRTKITKVLMNPPFENKFGGMKIVENVLDSVPAKTECAFILPDKKLEKNKDITTRILQNHRLRKIIKLPENLFSEGVTTSVFIFTSGIPQNGKEIFGCYMAEDGLETVKNKGRHDVNNKWADIENYWVNVVEKQSGDDTCQWINPNENWSYQLPKKPFSISKKDFKRTIMDYLMYKEEIDVKELKSKIMDMALYSSDITSLDNEVIIHLKKGEEDKHG